MKRVSEMNLSEVTLEILKTAVNIPDGLYARAKYLAKKEDDTLSKYQGIVLTGYTGKLLCSFSDFHEDVEKRLARPVFTHEFADENLREKIKALYKDEFLKIVGEI